MAVLGSDNLSHSTTFKININNTERLSVAGAQTSIPNANLYVGSNTDEITDTKKITVESRGFAGIELLGDTDNVTGEPGGAYIFLGQDGARLDGSGVTNIGSIIGMVNVTGQDAAGGTYTGTSSNNLLIGTRASSSDINFGTNNIVRMTVTAAGNVTATGTINALTFNATSTVNGGFQGISNDTATTPSFTWTGDLDTGMYRAATNTIGFVTSGAERVRIGSFGVRTATVGSGSSPAYQLENSDTGIYCSSTTNFIFRRNNTTVGVLRTDSATIRGVGSDTTTTAGNVHSNTSGDLKRSTSSIRYKKNVEDVDVSFSENIIFNARPVWYRSKCQGDNDNWSWWGFIAEELADIDPRLVHWDYLKEDLIKDHEDGHARAVDGAELHPESVLYERFTVHLVAIAKQQHQKIQQMEARIAALEVI